jgi:acylpyruvate hydrolase
MRVATVRTGSTTRAVRVEGDHLTYLPYADVGELIASGPDWQERAAAAGEETTAAAAAVYAPLVTAPEKIVCVGLNYVDHAEEAGLALPRYPTIFAKYSRSMIGANDPLVLPPNSDAVDWEIELGVVIGSTARHVDTEQAWNAVAGYTIINDISMRDWQERTSQFLQGKTFESSTPVGPYLVTPDEVDHAHDLTLECLLNGETMQHSSTGKLIFDVAEIISYLSEIITLVPGDVIATGTPAGVGAGRRPPRFLRPGDVLVTRIAGLGQQTVTCS